MTSKLFIGNLSHGVTDKQLQEHFAKAGKVLSAKVIIDNDGLGKGYGFVEMATVEEAEKAKATLNHTEIDGKKIEIKEEKHQA
jgi:RNA recognition motif-containing protein